jgi:hypothetical protein
MSEPKPDPTTARELLAAVALAEAAIRDADRDPADHTLIRAENILIGTDTCPGPRCWRLTFKRRDLIPAQMPAEIGAGGEIFVEVDLAASRARITGYGE